MDRRTCARRAFTCLLQARSKTLLYDFKWTTTLIPVHYGSGRASARGVIQVRPGTIIEGVGGGGGGGGGELLSASDPIRKVGAL